MRHLTNIIICNVYLICRKREELLACVEEVVEDVKPCLNDRQLEDLNVTKDAVDAGIDFVCHENGDRIACEYFY